MLVLYGIVVAMDNQHDNISLSSALWKLPCRKQATECACRMVLEVSADEADELGIWAAATKYLHTSLKCFVLEHLNAYLGFSSTNSQSTSAFDHSDHTLQFNFNYTLLVSECKIHQCFSPICLIHHFHQDAVISALKEPPELWLAGWVGLPANTWIVKILHENQDL